MSSNIDIKKICSWCGTEFIAYKTTTTCCSHRCANALYKKKKRDEVIKVNNQFTEKIVLEKPIERIKDKPFITITEAAVYLVVTRPTLYSYLKNGELKASRLGCKYLLRKEDIDELFNRPTEFRIQSKERTPITEFYTTAEIKEKYSVAESWIFVVAKKQNIPRTFNRGKTYWSKKHIDNYFAKKAANPEITEWYSVQEIQDKFDMTLAAIYTLVSKNTIPKKKVGIMVYYSKKHFDIAKGIAQPDEPQYYTVAEAMVRFNMTRDQIYHYVKDYNILKVREGKYTKISKPDLDKLFEAPKIE